jgi:hypothetical protein
VSVGVRERLPSPMAVDGVVTPDYEARTLAVRLPDSAGGHSLSLWRQAYGQLRRADEDGWTGSHPFLWGGDGKNREIVHGKPGDGLQLVFHFPLGESAFSRLIGKPGLRAIVTIDRNLCRFMSCQFLNRP